MKRKLFIGLIVLVLIIVAGKAHKNNIKTPAPADVYPTEILPSPSGVKSSSTPTGSKIVFTIGPGTYSYGLEHEGLTRTYKVHVPKVYSTSKPMPVVIALHGGGGNADSMQFITGLDAKADSSGFMVVYPQGSGTTFLSTTIGTWNGMNCCGQARERNIDDIGFIKKMIVELEALFNIDQKRIYATGISNGGTMVYRLACELSETIAAIAPIAPPLTVNDLNHCPMKRMVPVLQIHGTDDQCARYEGGMCGGCFEQFIQNAYGVTIPYTKSACTSAPSYIGSLIEFENCSAVAETTYKNGSAECAMYTGCDGSSEVTLCTITGGGHNWPGGNYGPLCSYVNSKACTEFKKISGTISTDLIANDMLWDFFLQHPMP